MVNNNTNRNTKKRKRNISYDLSPQHQQDCSPDRSPSNGTAAMTQEPGLGTIDFDASDCDDEYISNQGWTKDCAEDEDDSHPSIFNGIKGGMYTEKKGHEIVSDTYEEESEVELDNEDNQEENNSDDEGGLSNDENSIVGNTSDEDDEKEDSYVQDINIKTKNMMSLAKVYHEYFILPAVLFGFSNVCIYLKCNRLMFSFYLILTDREYV